LANWEVGQDTEYANSGDPDSFLAGVTSSNYTSTMRPSVHGDVLHSRPVAVNFGTDANPNVVVFYGANDGMLHAINGNKEGGNAIGGASPGGELWSFVPPEFYNSIASNLNDTAVNLTNVSQPTGKIYGMDGAINAYFTQAPDPNNAGKLLPPTDAYIYATMRRGGNAVYAFHYTFATPSTPTLAWKIDNTSSGFSGLGETWSTPMVLKTHWTTNPVMLIMGGGYDTCEDDYSSNPSPCRSSTTGNHIYVMDAKTGALLKTFQPTDRSVTGDVTVVPDYYLMDGSDTYAYASDLGGNLYRISGVDNTGAPAPFGNTDPSTWVMTKIASLGCDTVTTCTPNRKFMFGPDVVPESGINHILIGSGDREKPLADYTSAYNTTNYFFMVNDKPADSTAWLSSESTNCGSSVICLASLANINAGETPTEKGWYLGLSPHEQVVTSSVTLYGTTTFSTNIPPLLNAASSSECGATYVYNIAYTNAASNNGTGTPYQLVTGGGLPPSPVAGMVNLSAEDSGTGTATTMPFVIGGSPQSPVQAKKGGGSLPTLINQPKRRVYWYIQQ
jgi:type IV pilus assembly protein PilY1